MQAVVVLFLFSFFASAEESCRGPLSFEDQKISSFSNAIGEAVYFNEDLNGCSWDQQMRFYSSLKRVADRVDLLIEQGDSYDFSKAKGKRRRMAKRALKILKCIKKNKMDEMSFRCVDMNHKKCATAEAFVEGYEKTLFGIKVSRSFPDLEISVCADYYIDLPDAYLDGTVLHELSHHCGTDDLDYFMQLHNYKSPSAPLIDDWDKNAEMYKYWFSYPFCIPGIDCDEDHFFDL